MKHQFNIKYNDCNVDVIYLTNMNYCYFWFIRNGIMHTTDSFFITTINGKIKIRDEDFYKLKHNFSDYFVKELINKLQKYIDLAIFE